MVYVGPVLEGGIHCHKIKCSNGEHYIVDNDHLAAKNAIDLAIVPQQVQDYLNAAATLSKHQLKQVAHPITLGDNQKLLLEFHNRMNHLPFPQLIKLAQEDKLPTRLNDLGLGDRLPIFISCIFWTPT